MMTVQSAEACECGVNQISKTGFPHNYENDYNGLRLLERKEAVDFAGNVILVL